jgi:hypothetical protein
MVVVDAYNFSGDGFHRAHFRAFRDSLNRSAKDSDMKFLNRRRISFGKAKGLQSCGVVCLQPKTAGKITKKPVGLQSASQLAGRNIKRSRRCPASNHLIS